MNSNCPTLYNHFFLDYKSFLFENLKNVKDLDFHIKNVSSGFRYSFSIGPSIKKLRDLYYKLESLDGDIVNQTVLDELNYIIKYFRGVETSIEISDIKQKIPTDLKEILKINKNLKSILLNKKTINQLFKNEFNEKKRNDFYKHIPIHIKSIETFLDHNLINKITSNIQEGTYVKEFFKKNLLDLINISTNISILDKHCLTSLENTSKNAIHGLNFLFDLISDSNVKLIEIVCLSKERNNKLNPKEIIDLFSKKILKLDNKELIKKNTFSNSINLENVYFDFTDGASATKRVQIIMLKPTEFKKRDRFILFDEHSAIDIHDINSWTTTHEKLRQDTKCYIADVLEARKDFEKYKKKSIEISRTLEF